MIRVDKDACTGCGTCAAVCRQAAIALVDGVATVDEARCDGCECCLEACPQAAISTTAEALPVWSAPQPVAVISRPLAVARSQPLLARFVTGLAPVALDLAVGLADRWLSRRSATPSVSMPTGVTAMRTGRRMRRRRGWQL